MKSLHREPISAPRGSGTALAARESGRSAWIVEGARRDEENVVRAHETVARIDRGAFHNRQDVPLHALAAHVPGRVPISRPAILSISSRKMIPLDSTRSSAARVTCSMSIELLLLFLHQVIQSLGHPHLALPRLLAEQVGQHVFQVDAHVLDALVGGDLEASARGP